MALRETLLFILSGLPAHYLDREEPDARRNRLEVIADAVSDVSLRATCTDQYATQSCTPVWPLQALDLGVLLVTQAYSESRLAKNVHEGNCRAYECDPIRSAYTGQVHHRARSLWQIHRVGPIETEWEHMQGSDLASTTSAAWAAAILLSRGYRTCHSISGAITRYAGVRGCAWSEAGKRAKFYVALRERAVHVESRGTKPQPRPRATIRTSAR